MATRILVAGIGNIFLGDDGFGSEVIRHAEMPAEDPGVRVIDYGIRGMHLAYDLLEDWDEDWVTFERERVRQLRLHRLEQLSDRACAAGHFGLALQAALAVAGLFAAARLRAGS